MNENSFKNNKGTEICHSEKSMYREKKGVGSVISFHQLVSKSPTYVTCNKIK